MATTNTILNNGNQSLVIDVIAGTVGSLGWQGSPWAGAELKIQWASTLAPTIFRDVPFSPNVPGPIRGDGGCGILHLGPKMKVILDMPNPVPATGPSVLIEYNTAP